MPEEVEIETKELQDTIEELQEERKEREEEEKRTAWTRYIAMSTALLAVIAAIAAMQSGAMVNEAMMDQLKASDTWNEYQASRLKHHIYTIAANTLADAGVAAKSTHASAAEGEKPAASQHKSGHAEKSGHAGSASSAGEGKKPSKEIPEFKQLAPDKRLTKYSDQVAKETAKEEDLSDKAKEREHESAHKMHKHHQFAIAVAFIQVAVALSAIAALTKMRSVWILSMVIGIAGIVYFVQGLTP